MKNTHHRNNNVVLYFINDGSKQIQARIELTNGKWKRFGTGTEDEELRQLRRENKRLRMERDILKKAVVIFSEEPQ
jgi:transposase-like protein